ncbi:MAG: ABC transporter permease, partial [Acidimicrobiales bacterium]
VSPLAALRDVSVERTRPSAARVIAGVGLTGVGVALVLAGGSAFGIGAVSVVVGAIVLGPVVARPIAAALGAPLPPLKGVTGELARGNAVRNPRRTAGAATALVVGVGVVSLVTVTLASLSESTRQSYERSFGGDLAITSGAFGGGDSGFSPDLAIDVDGLPEVDRAVGLGGGEILVDGDTKEIAVADPAALADVLTLETRGGSLADLGEGDLAISSETADANGWDVGSTVAATYPDGGTAGLTIGAIYEEEGPLGGYLLPRVNWAPHTPQDLDGTVLIALAPGVDLERGRAAVVPVAESYGASDVQDRDEYVEELASAINDLLGIVYVLLALSVLIALLGIANTLSLSIHERTRELGLLRAVGQTARGVKSMVRWEAGIVAVFGTIGGLVLGLFLAWGLVRDLGADAGIDQFTVPSAQLAVIVVIGGIAGLLAGARPARRAARLRLLDALAAE